MKKLITILILGACAIARADDWADLLSLASQAEFVAETNEQRATVSANQTFIAAADVAKFGAEINDTAGRYVGLRIFQFESKPAFMRTRFAERHTFLWYVWNDYEGARGFEKLEFGKTIDSLSH